MKTDKQLLQLTKTELLEEYRKLEKAKNTSELTLEEAIEIVKTHDMIVRKKQHYNFQEE